MSFVKGRNLPKKRFLFHEVCNWEVLAWDEAAKGLSSICTETLHSITVHYIRDVAAEGQPSSSNSLAPGNKIWELNASSLFALVSDDDYTLK